MLIKKTCIPLSDAKEELPYFRTLMPQEINVFLKNSRYLPVTLDSWTVIFSYVDFKIR